MMNIAYRTSLAGTDFDFYDAREAVNALQHGAWDALPYTARVHAENLVRRADPAQLNDYLRQLIVRRRERDFSWYPVRVVCHDILGQTALVDLAGLRDAIAVLLRLVLAQMANRYGVGVQSTAPSMARRRRHKVARLMPSSAQTWHGSPCTASSIWCTR